MSAFDALHDIRLVSQRPVISSLRKPSMVFGWAPFQNRDIDNRPGISFFDAETGRVVFSDKTFVDDVDIVLFATGYGFSFPFLPHVQPANGRVPGLYEHVFDASDPSLAFIGMVSAHAKPFRLCLQTIFGLMGKSGHRWIRSSHI